MSDYVTLRHPSLPDDQTITVAASAVPHHRAAGWVPAAELEPAPEPAPAALEETEPQPARKRRRATEGE
ncbi:hypothetical protein [Streptomyces sp. NPDC045251]|uniref:hypothetical protein n=1 Tax=unclassified Streptomyces TaxID=2593676 RepID=UPI0033C2BDAA